MAAHLRRRLEELDAQIVEQRRLLHALQQTRLGVEQELHATATYPVLTLPTEITTEIFTSCLAVFDPLSLPELEDETYAPIVLAGVCRAWRDIAFTTPILWSQLKVRFRSFTREMTLKPRLIEESIDRDNHIDTLGLDSVAFPLLRGATLTCAVKEYSVISSLTTVFDSAPRLHELNLGSQITARGYRFPWTQLTKFDGPIDDTEIFALTPNLTEMIGSGGTYSRARTHRSLKSLFIKNDTGIIPRITLPALQHLTFLPDLDLYDVPSSLVVSFLERSLPPLISLSVQWSESWFDSLRQCIPLVAGSLESLEFHDEFSVALLDFLDSSILDSLPHIHTLGFTGLDPRSNLPALLCFLYARSDKIRTLRVRWTSDPFPDRMVWAGPPGTKYLDTINDHFWRLGQAGMEIYSKVSQV
ncbi:hypothetical protein K438DRAFT_2009051 [Mycena galopus ATCC 62051]|nr:hypothetical protein K438DRAFT_2009051 [Mycena galopus ATCC 62051]